MHRRELFNAAMAAGATVMTAGSVTVQAAQDSSEIIDTNISLFQWPFRRLPLDEVRPLVEQLQTLGVCEAWAGSFEALLHRDISSVNARLVEVCSQFALLRPVGELNLRLPDWQADWHRCIENYGMHAVRLHPNYHGYGLAAASFRELVEMATATGRIVQIAASMEDPRTQHPMLRVPDVDLAPLTGILRDFPTARIQILNARLRGSALEGLATGPGPFFDTARIEGTTGVADFLRELSPDRVLYGSHAPLLIPRAALIRTFESPLTPSERRRLLSENARALLQR